MDESIKTDFIEWFLSLPNVDETLVDENSTKEDGRFSDSVIQMGYESFIAGYGYGKHSRI